MNTQTVERMSRAEKLRAMEALRASLCREEAPLESPDWHRIALEETAARHAAGQEPPIDWDAAKRELRHRAE